MKSRKSVLRILAILSVWHNLLAEGVFFMKTKVKSKMIAAACICGILTAAVVLTILFASAKPVFGAATFRPIPEKIIMAYTFDGMTFSPALKLAAKNYPLTDDGYGKSSRVSSFCCAVNENIENALADHLDGNYNEYYVHSSINENTCEKTVMVFCGDGTPVNGGERETIDFKLVIDWNKAKNPGDEDFVEIR